MVSPAARIFVDVRQYRYGVQTSYWIGWWVALCIFITYCCFNDK